jgi:hypothetical protein
VTTLHQLYTAQVQELQAVVNEDEAQYRVGLTFRGCALMYLFAAVCESMHDCPRSQP